jgi:hypothetical protein
VLPPGEAESDGVGEPPPDSVPLGDGEADSGDGEPDCDGDGDGDGEPSPGDGEADCGDGEPDWGDGELEAGGGLPDPPVGGGGDCGGWLRKMRMAINTASAASSNISSQETKMVRQPARSYRPGQGNGQSRVRPGRTRSIQ